MHEYYGENFYWTFEGGKLDQDAVLAARMPQILAKKEFIVDLAPGRLLDIGAMKGEFVHSMRVDGWSAEGVDFSPHAENLFDVPMRYGDFLQLDYEEASFDCVTMWAVLEHVYEPSAYVAKVARLLKPGGRFVLLVTNFNSIQGRWYRADDYPRHLTFFTKGSLKRLLTTHGLEVATMNTNQKIFGGSLYGSLVFAAKLFGGYGVDEAFYEWHNWTDSHAFCCKWRGRESPTMTWISRVDRLLSLPLESLIDQLGHGFILVCVAQRSHPAS
jgi:SAM-dependent methyltransferase